MLTTKLKATPQIVRGYQELFVNRRAYTMQSLPRILLLGGTIISGQAKREPMCPSC